MAEIIIIGAGVSGLSAGIELLKAGHGVTIYDRQSVAGGNLTAWKRKEHVIDNCIHWFTGTNPNSNYYKKWVDVGAITTDGVTKAEYLYKSYLNGESLALYRDIEKTREEMLKLSPVDEKEINSFINAVNKVKYLSNTGGKGNDEKNDLVKTILAVPSLIKYYNLSLYDLAEKFSHPLIKRFFTDYIGGIFGALAYVITASTFCSNNGDIPVGSSLKTAKNMTDKFLTLGGKLKLNEKAIKAFYNGNHIKKLLFESGITAYADYFIFTGDVFDIYANILNKPMPNALLRRFNNRKLERFSSMHVAYSVDVKDLPFKNTVIKDVPFEKLSVLKDTRLKLREYSHDKSLAPEGKTVIQSISFCNQASARYIIRLAENKQEYKKFKNDYVDALTYSIEKEFPSLKGKLTFLDCWTPYTYKRYTGATLGEYMSFIYPEKLLPTTIKNTVKGVKNAVIGSQWLTIPGGLPNALKVGINASNTVKYLIRKDAFYLKKTITPITNGIK